MQKPAHPEAGLQGCGPQAYDAGGSACQGGAQAKAHAGRGQQAKGRENEGCHRGADMSLPACIILFVRACLHYPSRRETAYILYPKGEEQVHCINSSQRADGTRINKRIYIQTLWPNAFDRPAAASCSLASSMSSLKEPSGLLDRAFQSLIHTFRQCQCRRLEFHERTRLTTKRAYTTLVSFIFQR